MDKRPLFRITHTVTDVDVAVRLLKENPNIYHGFTVVDSILIQKTKFGVKRVTKAMVDILLDKLSRWERAETRSSVAKIIPCDTPDVTREVIARASEWVTKCT